MKRGTAATLAALALVGAAAILVARSAAPADGAQELAFLKKRLALLESENARLHGLVKDRDHSDTRETQVAIRTAIEREVEEIRGLKFLKPVDYDVVTREQIRDTVAGKLSQQYSDEDFHNMAAGLAAIGLLPENFPLKEKYLDLLGEQIAAFYDQHEHKLYMFENASLEKMENRVILAHELTHALQDQHFHLSKLPLEVKDDDDRAFAAAALIEGDATVVMTEYMLKNLTAGNLRGTIASMFAQNMEQLAEAPVYLREMLLFPYMRGQEFAMALQAYGGYRKISDSYAQVPESTAQILHPEKYIVAPMESPVRIRFPDREVLGAKSIARNTIGEIGVRILFAKWIDEESGRKIGIGWRGDRYAAFPDGEGASVVWRTEWANEDDAREFAEALERYTAKRYGDKIDTRTIAVETEGNTVIFIDANTPEWRDGLQIFAAER